MNKPAFLRRINGTKRPNSSSLPHNLEFVKKP